MKNKNKNNIIKRKIKKIDIFAHYYLYSIIIFFLILMDKILLFDCYFKDLDFYFQLI